MLNRTRRAGLPHETLMRIWNRLDPHALRGLVAIFTRKEDAETACFYLSPRDFPWNMPLTTQLYPLSDLETWLEEEFDRFDGVVLSWLAIDVAYPDIPTKGARFYALEQEYRKRHLEEEMRRIWAHLAEHFLSLMREENDRFKAKILQLITPTLLARIPREGLVGVVPHPQWRGYVRAVLSMAHGRIPEQEEPAAHLIYTHEPPSFPPELDALFPRVTLAQAPSIITGQEALIFEDIAEDMAFSGEPLFPLDLRDLLRRAGLDEEIPHTLEALIRHFYTRWRHYNSDQDLRHVGELWLERTLLDRDTNDLVAVIPRGAPQEEGFPQAAFVYRRLPERWSHTPPAARDILSLEQWRENAVRPSRLWFSLLPLKHWPSAQHARPWLDLGPIFYKVGKTRTLARNAWLLVQETGEWRAEERTRVGISITEELHTMVHSCALLSLENPWNWRQGRYFPMLVQAYQTLQHVIRRLVQHTVPPKQLYYQALGYWYRCALAEDPEAVRENMRQMDETLTQFHRICRDRCPQVGQTMVEQATHLHNLSKAVLHLLGGGGQPDVLQQLYPQELRPTVASVPRTMKHMASMDHIVDIPSILFREAFQRYAQTLMAIQNIQGASIPVDDKIRQLRTKVRELRRAQRVAYALYHETQVLQALYTQAIQQTEGVIRDLEGGAHLVVQLLTRAAPHHQDAHITFEVRNIGRVEAQDITASLVLTEDFRLKDESALKRIPIIRPHEQTLLSFTIRPETDRNIHIRLNVTYRHARDSERKVTHSWEFPIQVVSLDQGPFTLKPNPYIYGVPLQEPRLFYGRRQELQALLNHLAHRRPQNILVRGARRSGKTSLLNMVKAVLEDRDRHTGARDRFEIPASWDENLNTIHPIFLSLQSLERLDDVLTPTVFFKTILQALADGGLALPYLDRFLARPTLGVQQFERYLRDLLEQHPELHIVLLLDEFDVVDLIAEKAFYAHLRHVISQVQRITWIIASALGLYREVSDYESPLFNVFKIVDLGPLERDAARRLILDPWDVDAPTSSGQTLQIVDDAVVAILEETACYPYFIQLLCSEIVSYVNRRQTNYVLRRTVYDVIDSITDPRSPLSEHFAYLWDRVDGLSKLMLLLLLREATPPSEGELLEAVHAWLEEEGLEVQGLKNAIKHRIQRLNAMEAIQRDRFGRLTFGIPLFQRLLGKRSEQEDLWDVIRFELKFMGKEVR